MHPGPEFITSWKKVTAPTQRLVAEYGEFEKDSTVPLQLNIYGANSYVDRVLSALKAQKLPVRTSKTEEVRPVTGLIAMSDFSSVREGTDAMFFGRSPDAGLTDYSTALKALVDSSNRALALQQLDPIPAPPMLKNKTKSKILEEESA